MQTSLAVCQAWCFRDTTQGHGLKLVCNFLGPVWNIIMTQICLFFSPSTTGHVETYADQRSSVQPSQAWCFRDKGHGLKLVCFFLALCEMLLGLNLLVVFSIHPRSCRNMQTSAAVCSSVRHGVSGTQLRNTVWNWSVFFGSCVKSY